MKRRKTVGAAELREQAAAARAAAEAEARLVLEKAGAAAERLERRADDLEHAERVREGMAEIAAEAAGIAQTGLEARSAGEAAATDADRHAARRAELEAVLERAVALRRQRLAGIEQLTAAGELDRALALEKGLDEVDLEPLRAELAEEKARQDEARDRSAQAQAVAEQCAAETAELRRSLELLEDELRPEYERRREERERQRLAALLAFDFRLQNATAVLIESKPEPSKPKPDSANMVLPDGPTAEVDRGGRLLGVSGL